MFKRGERVSVGASGGKDSTVLIHILHTLNERFDYGIDLQLVSIDEGIKGFFIFFIIYLLSIKNH